VDHHRIFIAEKTIKEDGRSITLYIFKPEKTQGTPSVILFISTVSASRKIRLKCWNLMCSRTFNISWLSEWERLLKRLEQAMCQWYPVPTRLPNSPNRQQKRSQQGNERLTIFTKARLLVIAPGFSILGSILCPKISLVVSSIEVCQCASDESKIWIPLGGGHIWKCIFANDNPQSESAAPSTQYSLVPK